MRFSILIPARNEETLLPGCLESIQAAAEPFPLQVEVIVAVNRCTDRTKEITKAHIVTSCRKFDMFGDWYLIRHPGFVWRIFTGKSQKDADSFYYDVDR